jgi:hypothetical protein
MKIGHLDDAVDTIRDCLNVAEEHNRRDELSQCYRLLGAYEAEHASKKGKVVFGPST